MSTVGCRKHARILSSLVALLASGLIGCEHAGGKNEAHDGDGDGDADATSKEKTTAPAEAVPASIAVPATNMVSGFAGGVLRQQVDLPAFRITQHPVTRGQYAECVDAKVCAKSKAKGCLPSAYEQLRGRGLDQPDSPLACATIAEATSYCGWIGGRLPKLPEWMLAARGPKPQRFAWGDDDPTCDRHPRAADVPGRPMSEEAMQEAGCVPALEDKLPVGAHEAGAAPSGMQDVLLTPAELVAPEKDAQFAACSTGFAGCFVYGGMPGEIDAVFPISKHAPSVEQTRATHVYGFRCVLEEN